MKIFCDFDGTISTQDTTDYILTKLAKPQWEEIEVEWKKGEIGSAECMMRQIALISATEKQLNATLDETKIDESFISFARHFESIGAKILILSDGVDHFIKRILAKHGLDHLPVIANRLHIESSSTYSLNTPFSNYSCKSAAGVCKCSIVGSNNDLSIYIGDGRSDFCVADKTDMVFAKKALAEYCKKINLAYMPYETFSDVKRALTNILPQPVTTKSRDHFINL